MFPSGYTGDRHREFQRRAHRSGRGGARRAGRPHSDRACRSGSAATTRPAVGVEGYVPRENEEIVINYTHRRAEVLRDDGHSDARRAANTTSTDTLAIAAHDRHQRGDGAALLAEGQRARRPDPPGPEPRRGDRHRRRHRSTAASTSGRCRSCSSRWRAAKPARCGCSCGPAAIRARWWPSVRNAIRGIDANLPVYDARTLTEHMQVAVFAQRMAANLLGAMGVLALLLAAIGLYGVMAYAVSQRTQEMGIRLALGASPGSLLEHDRRAGHEADDDRAWRSGWSIALGAFGSIGAVRTLLPGISPLDPITFIAVPIVLGLDRVARVVDPGAPGGEGRSARGAALRIVSDLSTVLEYACEGNASDHRARSSVQATALIQLLVAKRDHRIDPRGAPRGQIAGRERHRSSSAPIARADRPDVGRRQAEQHALDESPAGQRAGQAD